MSLLSISCTPIVQRLFSQIVPGVDEDTAWLEKAIKSLAKKLRKTRQLDDFEKVLHTKEPLSKCVTLMRSLDGRLQISHKKVLPHVVFCRLFRWPDLHSYHELKSLGNCQYSFQKKQQLLCINPFHFYRTELLIMPPICITKNSKNKDYQPKTSNGNRERVKSFHPLNQNLISTPEYNFNGFPKMVRSPVQNISYVMHDQYNQEYPETIINFDSPINAPINLITDNQKAILMEDIVNLIPSQMTVRKYDDLNSINIYDNFRSNFFIEPQMNIYPNEPFYLQNGNSLNVLDKQDNISDLQRQIDEQVKNSVLPALYNYINLNQKMFDSQEDCIFVNYETCKNWVEISYYEYKKKIGNTFLSNSKTICVDFNSSSTTQNIFGLLGCSSNEKDDKMSLLKSSIGIGFKLTHGGGEVMIECLSKSTSFFINSSNINFKENISADVVRKLERGDCVTIFDYHDFAPQLSKCICQSYESVYQLLSWTIIRTSFIKGWGTYFKRRNPDETPIWFEIKLIGPLTWLDRVIRQLGAPSTKCSSMT